MTLLQTLLRLNLSKIRMQWSRLKLPLLPYPTDEFLEVVWEVRNRKPKVDWELFVATAWGLWNQRNTVRFGGQRKTTHKLCRDVEEYVKEFRHENPPHVSHLDHLLPLGNRQNRAGIKLMWTGCL